MTGSGIDNGEQGPSFLDAATPMPVAPGQSQLFASEHWAQGRTQFGGLVAAAITNAMARECDDDLHLRTLSVAFAAPITTGTALINATVDRTGSSTAFTSAVVSQEGAHKARAQGVFVRNRDSAITVKPPLPTMDVDRDQAQEFPYIEGVVPRFLKKFELRLGVGSFPFSGATHGTIGGYARHNPPVAGTSAILGLLDAWPPAILPMATGPAAGSTVSWTAHILSEVPQDADAWYTFRYDTIASDDGYATFVGTLACEGKVVAWSEQLAAVFA
ncbi:MAG: thioesterase family protein [Candidatus Nanopelagicales bacterium]